MLTKQILKEIIFEQRKLFLDVKDAYKREILDLPKVKKVIFETNEIIIITGVRRCGKSYLLRLIWQKIKEEIRTDDNQFFYLNFEDERLISFKTSDFNLLLESYFELFEVDKSKKIYFFLDEIQNIENWQKFLNRLRENKNYKIFVSGSNAVLLSKEISTQLTGRNIPLTLYPFSFREYLFTQLPSFKEKDIYDPDKKIKIRKIFRRYLENGGFPEIIKTNYRPLLQEYLRNIIYRDIVLRYKIRYEASLREIVNFLLTNTGTILSLKKISEMTEIKNISTIKNYLEYLKNSFLFYSVPIYSFSIKKQIYNPDKIYVCDLGIYNEIGFKFSQNQGKILENFVFLELQRRYPRVYYSKDNNSKEIDFVISQKNKVNLLIQSCFDLSDSKTKKREVTSLLKGMDKYNLKKGYVFTDDYELEENYPQGKICFIPAWKYFLMN